MPYTVNVLRILLLVILPALYTASPLAQTATDLTSAGIQSKLDKLAERKLAEAEHKTAQEALEKALSHIQLAEQNKQRLTELNKRVQQAPAIITKARSDLAKLKKTPRADMVKDHGAQPLAELEQLFLERNTRMGEWQQALGEVNTQIISAQTRPERVQADIGASQTRIATITGLLQSGRQGTANMSAEQRDALLAEQLALESKNLLLRQELAGITQLQEIAQAESALLTERISRVEAEVQALQTLINERRRDQSEKIIADLWREAGEENANSLLARENTANVTLSNTLLDATDRLNTLTQRNLEVRQQLENLRQSDQAQEELTDVLQGSLLLAKILHQQKDALPQLQYDDTLSNQIADIRLNQFDINQQRAKISNPEAYVDEQMATQPAELASEELRQALLNVVATRSELIDGVNRELNALLNESINLQLNQKELQTTAASLRNKLDEQLFWIPSNRGIDISWLKSLPGKLQQQVTEMPWRSVLAELWAGLQAYPLVFLPLLILIPVLIWRRSWMSGKLNNLHRHIGYVRQDSQWHTPLAIVLHILYGLPFALLLGLCGAALLMDARGQNISLGIALLQTAQVWLVFYTAYRLLAHGGVAELHFRWSRERTEFLRRQIFGIGLVAMALTAVATIAEHQPSVLGNDIVGTIVVLIGYGLLVWLLPKLFWFRKADERLSALRWMVGVAFGLMPMALIVAVVAGYYYTALKLTGRLIDTLSLLIIWRLVEAILVRSLSLAAQRLAYQRILKKHETAVREGVEGVEVVEEPILNIEKVNQQSLRLMRVALLGVFLVLLYWVWADLITLFAYLDNITLYEYNSGTSEAPTLVPISLRDVIGALVIAGIAVILARNIPGLLEVSVLSRMNLAQGSAYATTTLLSYIIFSIGFVATLGALGVSWNKLQWLVAALSVGLGFGLQEIFANFISGLIILFERPVRIGDVVTIGNLSGSVSRIRIRATTITDFDRKEIIVPNKVFVTDQLINWSLNDTITRVTVKVGVAYGSDLDKTRELLLQIATENPRVLSEPAPMVLFLSFGPSTLDHELRIHVRELMDRNAAIDEINRRIDVLFRENNINIAFSQMDVHIRSITGQEQKLMSVREERIEPLQGGAAPSTDSDISPDQSSPGPDEDADPDDNANNTNS